MKANENIGAAESQFSEGEPPKHESGPNKLAADCERVIPELIAARDAAKTAKERKQLSSRLKTARYLLRWAKTRAGYVAAPPIRKTIREGAAL